MSEGKYVLLYIFQRSLQLKVTSASYCSIIQISERHLTSLRGLLSHIHRSQKYQHNFALRAWENARGKQQLARKKEVPHTIPWILSFYAHISTSVLNVIRKFYRHKFWIDLPSNWPSRRKTIEIRSIGESEAMTRSLSWSLSIQLTET